MTLSLVLRAVGLGVAAGALSLSAAQAAPPNLVSSSPGPQNGWEAFPKQLKLTFNQPIATNGDDVQLMGPDGRRVHLGTPAVSGDALTVKATPATQPPVAGPYMVTWQAKSASGEEGKGNFSIFVQ